jgi:hypothetical protein
MLWLFPKSFVKVHLHVLSTYNTVNDLPDKISLLFVFLLQCQRAMRMRRVIDDPLLCEFLLQCQRAMRMRLRMRIRIVSSVHRTFKRTRIVNMSRACLVLWPVCFMTALLWLLCCCGAGVEGSSCAGGA